VSEDVEDVEQVAAISDPAVRARVATELVSKHQEIVTQLARIRRNAISELRAQGLSLAQVGEAIGVTRGRIAQIHSTSHVLEQDFFGGTSVTITTPLRASELGRPLVAQEDAEAAAQLAQLLTGFDITVSTEHVTPDGRIDLSPDGLVAICGPKSSATMRQIIDTDPALEFSPDAQDRWRLRDRATGQEHHSPIDLDPDAGQDVAYLARLHRPDGRPLLVIAGVHAVGSLGVVAFLSDSENIRELHRAVGRSGFSLVVGCQFTRTPLKILAAEALTKPHLHDREDC
jgi:transcriptional regulator with XRE-family HTH domain